MRRQATAWRFDPREYALRATVSRCYRSMANAHGAMPGKGLSPESRHEEFAAVSTKAEAGLYSEAVVIKEQARQAHLLKGGENLLPVASGTFTSEQQTKEPKP